MEVFYFSAEMTNKIKLLGKFGVMADDDMGPELTNFYQE
jgi:hypothetical protein